MAMHRAMSIRSGFRVGLSMRGRSGAAPNRRASQSIHVRFNLASTTVRGRCGVHPRPRRDHSGVDPGPIRRESHSTRARDNLDSRSVRRRNGVHPGSCQGRLRNCNCVARRRLLLRGRPRFLPNAVRKGRRMSEPGWFRKFRYSPNSTALPPAAFVLCDLGA